MRRRFAASLVLFSALALAAGAAPAQQSPAPSAVVLETVRDFGPVAKGGKLTHVFEIRNEGDAVLEITEVKAHCGCAVADYDAVIAPGAVGNVRAVIDTKNLRGPIAKSVTLFTSDAENPRVNLVIKADVVVHVEVEPSYARFLTVERDVAEPSVHIVFAPGLPEFEISRVESPFPFLEVSFAAAPVELRRPESDGKQWRVEVKLLPSAPVGPFHDFVQVHTNHPRRPVQSLPVSGYVRPVIAVSPPFVDFGSTPSGESRRAILEIENQGDGEVALSSPSADLEQLDARLEAVDRGRSYRLHVTLKPGLPAGPFEGTVHVRTTSALHPELAIPVKGVAI